MQWACVLSLTCPWPLARLNNVSVQPCSPAQMGRSLPSTDFETDTTGLSWVIQHVAACYCCPCSPCKCHVCVCRMSPGILQSWCIRRQVWAMSCQHPEAGDRGVILSLFGGLLQSPHGPRDWTLLRWTTAWVTYCILYTHKFANTLS